jgi:hypothetical protein
MYVLISSGLSKTIDTNDKHDPIVVCLTALEQSESIQEFQAQGQYSQSEQFCVHFGIRFVGIKISRSARLIVGILQGYAFAIEHIPTHDYQKTVVGNPERMKSYRQAIKTSHIQFSSYTNTPAFNPPLNNPPVVTYQRGQAIILTQTQVAASNTIPGRGTICIGSAGTGKTVVSVNRLHHYVSSGLKTGYLAPTAKLAKEVEAEFIEDRLEIVPPHCFDWDGFLDWLEQQANFNTTPFRYIPNGRFQGVASLEQFETWCQERKSQGTTPSKASFKKLCSHIKIHSLYREFCSVFIQPLWSNTANAYLSEENYLSLGRFQSYIFDASLRSIAYQAFKDYVIFLDAQHFYEPRLIAQQLYQALSGHVEGIAPLGLQDKLDALVLDEVQKFHPWQWACTLLAVRELRMGNFFICGDANQMVNHQAPRLIEPLLNFFDAQRVIPQIEQLQLNHRNSQAVTKFVRQLNEIEKNMCGSQERYTHLTLQANEEACIGTVQIKRADDTTFQHEIAGDANAVILIPSDLYRQDALALWQDKQLFTLDEFQGLSAQTILLYGFSSCYSSDLTELKTKLKITGVPSLENPKAFSKHKDAENSSLSLRECIQALYTGAARAEQQLLIMTLSDQDELSSLVQLMLQATPTAQPAIKIEESTAEQWAKQAELYEQKGQLRQAQAIRQSLPSQQKKEHGFVKSSEKINKVSQPALSAQDKNTSSAEQVVLTPSIDEAEMELMLMEEIKMLGQIMTDHINQRAVQTLNTMDLDKKLAQLVAHPIIQQDPIFQTSAAKMYIYRALISLMNKNYKEAIAHLNNAEKKDSKLPELYRGYICALKLQNPHPNAKLKNEIKKQIVSMVHSADTYPFSFLSNDSGYMSRTYSDIFLFFSDRELVDDWPFFVLIINQIAQYNVLSGQIGERLSGMLGIADFDLSNVEGAIRACYLSYFERHSDSLPASSSLKTYFSMLVDGANSAHGALCYSVADQFIRYMETIIVTHQGGSFPENLIVWCFKVQRALILNDIELATRLYFNIMTLAGNLTLTRGFIWYPLSSGLHLISKYYYRAGANDTKSIRLVLDHLKQIIPISSDLNSVIPACEAWVFDLNKTNTLKLLHSELSKKAGNMEYRAWILYILTEIYLKDSKNNQHTKEERNNFKKMQGEIMIELSNMSPELLPAFLFLKQRQHFSNYFAQQNSDFLKEECAKRHAKNPNKTLTLFYDAMDFLAMRKPSETAEAIEKLKNMKAEPFLYQSCEAGLKALVLSNTVREEQGKVYPHPLDKVADEAPVVKPLSFSALT